MTPWDADDLLVRCKRQAMEPDISQVTTPEDWYAMLTQAEAHWKPIIAAHYPGPMYGPPTLMLAPPSGDPTTGMLFAFPDPTDPLQPCVPLGQVEVYTSQRGTLMRQGAYWDRGADFVMEGDKIRITNGRSMTFSSNAPWARYVGPPGIIRGSDDTVTPPITMIDSTIQPPYLRQLLIDHALYLWASRGGFQDPQYYRALEQKDAFGDPDIPGDVGMLGALKLQSTAHGMAGYSHDRRIAWWRPNG